MNWNDQVLNKEDIESIFNIEDVVNVSSNNLLDLLIEVGSAKSKREAREFITNGSISVNGCKVTDLEMLISKDACLFKKFVIIRRGKKKYYIGIFE